MRRRLHANYFPIRKHPKKIAKKLNLKVHGMAVANMKNRTRRVDEGKSGQAQITAVSGGFGGGILSQDLQQAFDSLGEQSGVCDAVDGRK